MKVITTSDLRQNLQDTIDGIFYTGTPVIIMRRNKPRAIITPLPENDKNIDKIIDEHIKLSADINNK